MSNVTFNISLRSLSKLSDIKNIATIKSILNSFEDSFLFFSIPKFDYSIRKQTQNPKKIYSIDNGLINSVSFKFSEDKGRLLENLTAIELKRRSKEFYYSAEKNECDFLVKEKLKIKQAIQVCYNINEKNERRELDGLLEAMEKFKLNQGWMITYNQEKEEKINGKTIKFIPLWKWLLE